MAAEVAAKVKADLPDASDEEREAEIARRIEALKAKNQLIEQWDLDHVDADLSRCGLAGSPTKVFRVQSIVLTKEGLHRDSAHRGGRASADPRIGR